MSSSSFATLFAQVSNAASSVATGAATDASGAAANTPQAPWYTNLIFPLLIAAMVYFAMIRPQMQATKAKAETIKTARTGDKVVTSSGIHGMITNVKDNTVIVKIADNVKIEIEKSHIEKITRESEPAAEKIAAKVS